MDVRDFFDEFDDPQEFERYIDELMQIPASHPAWEPAHDYEAAVQYAAERARISHARRRDELTREEARQRGWDLRRFGEEHDVNFEFFFEHTDADIRLNMTPVSQGTTAVEGTVDYLGADKSLHLDQSADPGDFVYELRANYHQITDTHATPYITPYDINEIPNDIPSMSTLASIDIPNTYDRDQYEETMDALDRIATDLHTYQQRLYDYVTNPSLD